MSSELMCTAAMYITRNIPAVTEYVDSKLKGKSPSSIIVATMITTIALWIFARSIQAGWGKTRRDQIGTLALRLPYIQKKYAEDMKKQRVHFRESVLKKWADFGEVQVTLPEKGWSYSALMSLIQRYSQITAEKVKEKHFSGTIYSRSLVSFPQQEAVVSEMEECTVDDPRYFEFLSLKLQSVFTRAYQESQLWNSLHSDEFAIGACIDYQVVRIVADMFGGSKDEVMGFVTSGGTESLMVAVRSYRDWGMKHRGHEPGDGVILASESVHAGVVKAGTAYNVKIVLVATDESGNIDLDALKESAEKYSDRLIGIIGSAPSYPTGNVDPIEEMALIAQDNRCGMHVDCCLGGFIVNFQPNAKYLKIPGVTSLSVDTHKNGMAPKGSSVLVTKKLGEENLAYYSIYSIPGWSGGPYGTPKDAGSQSCVHSFNALLALLGTGLEGYQRLARDVHETAVKLAECIEGFKGRMRLLSFASVNVVAFKIDEEWGLEKGATYAFAHELSKRHFVLNTMKNDTAHFCVTVRFASDPDALGNFAKAVEESLAEVKRLNDRLLAEGKKFSGDAGMYCALEAALTPDRNTLSKGKYLENWLLGRQGAHDAIRSHFLAQLDPYATD
jgi:glutamate/tyrosine decarboxylase-like PLP-dependent enzyme